MSVQITVCKDREKPRRVFDGTNWYTIPPGHTCVMFIGDDLDTRMLSILGVKQPLIEEPPK